MSDIPSWAVRGSKVVCIEQGWERASAHISDPYGLITYPVYRTTYTIREVRVRYVSEHNEVLIGVLLDEIVNPIAEGGSATGEEMGWDIRAFSPVKRASAVAEARRTVDA